jgi:hypothetical protein
VDPGRDGWNLYAYVGNNPIKFVDPDGFEILFVGERADKLEEKVTELEESDPDVKATLDLYRQPGSPDLIFTFGDPGNDKHSGNTNLGVFKSGSMLASYEGNLAEIERLDSEGVPHREIFYDSENPGTARFVTGVEFLEDSTIVIRRGSANKGVLKHEIGHADHRIRDPLDYARKIAYDAVNGIPHDDRKVEKYAIKYAKGN